MPYQLVVPPTEEPVTLAQAKVHLRVDASDDDNLITGLIVAARRYVERFTRRALVAQTWRLTLSSFPSRVIALPMVPLLSVTSVTYKDSFGTSIILDPAVYAVAQTDVSAVLVADGWPYGAPVTIDFVAGYGPASAVDAPLKQAILLLIGHWYAVREAMAPTTMQAAPWGVEALLASYQVPVVA